MKAIQIHEHGDVNVLKYDDIDYPKSHNDKVILEVKSASINHLDLWVRRGWPNFDVELPLILGSDASGTLVEIGSNVKGWNVGDDVLVQPGIFCADCLFCNTGRENFCLKYGILGETMHGVQAEFISLNPQNIYPKPSIYTFEEAASMPLVFMTAYQMLVRRARLTSNETVLVYGANSGVGSAAIQIAKSFDSMVIATVGTDEKKNHAFDLGADYVVNHYRENLYNNIKDIVGRKGIDVIFEHVGYKTWTNSVKLLAKGGRLVTCGSTTGSRVDIDLKHLFMKQQSILGSTMSDIISFNEVMDRINSGILKPFVDKIFPFIDIQSAHEYIENGNQIGKVVLVP